MNEKMLGGEVGSSFFPLLVFTLFGPDVHSYRDMM